MAFCRYWFIPLLFWLMKTDVNCIMHYTNDTRLQYCQKDVFTNTFIKRNKFLPGNLSAFMDNNCAFKCESPAYAFFTLSRKLKSFETGAFEVKKTDNCWVYYYELHSKKQNKVLYHRYITANDTSPGDIYRTIWNQTEEQYGDTYFIRLVRIPGGGTYTIRRGYYKNKCHQLAYMETVKYFWNIYGTGTCRRYFTEWNVFAVSEKICQHLYTMYTEPSKQTITRYVNQSLDLNQCTLYVNRPFPTALREGAKPDMRMYVWVSIGIVLSLVASVVVFKCYIKHTKEENSSYGRNTNKDTQQYHSTKESRLNDDTTKDNPSKDLSVMIIHRPGCDLLDTFVRDLAFIIHSYDVTVTSPLLEMSNIDAEGGLASYIQRNVLKCSYILILVTQFSNNDSEEISHLQRPFDFTMTMLSGLAFHQNEVSRYIPIYINQYKDIFDFIPPFLCANKTPGFQIPFELDRLIGFMQNKTTEAAKRPQRVEFFMEKLKKQSDLIESKSHASCFKQQCLKGELSDDVSILWSCDTSTTVTQRSMISSVSCHDNVLRSQQNHQHGSKAVQQCENYDKSDNNRIRLATNNSSGEIKRKRNDNDIPKILSIYQLINDNKQQLRTKFLCTRENDEIFVEDKTLNCSKNDEFNIKHNGIIVEKLHGTEAGEIENENQHKSIHDRNIIGCSFVENKFVDNNPATVRNGKFVESPSILSSLKRVENETSDNDLNFVVGKEFKFDKDEQTEDNIEYKNTKVENEINVESEIVEKNENYDDQEIFKTQHHQHQNNKTENVECENENNYLSTTTTTTTTTTQTFNIDGDYDNLTFNNIDDRLVGFAENENLAHQFSREKVLNWKVSIL